MDSTVTTGCLDFAELRAANFDRVKNWHGDDTEPWSLADWSNAMCGEAGETANVVKKIRRHQTGIGNGTGRGEDELYAALAEEIADTVIYADLLAGFAGIDLADAVREKFNRVSDERGFTEQI